LVEVWTEDILKGIKLTKMRIKHHEKHGCGTNVIADKATLKKQEHHRDVRNGTIA